VVTLQPLENTIYLKYQMLYRGAEVESDKVEHLSNITAWCAVLATYMGGLWHWLDVNHASISSLCMLISTAIALGGIALSIFRRLRRLYHHWNAHHES